MTRGHLSASLLALGALVGVGCGADPGGTTVDASSVGDVGAGRAAIGAYGCGSCHTIPGISGADATVGPPLTDWAQRVYIAGNLVNTPDNLQRWLLDPRSIEPGTAMPVVGLSPEEAADIAAYLYTLGD